MGLNLTYKIEVKIVMPAQAGMTAMDGGNANGLLGAALAHYK
jgi:hypothetical protein